MSTSAARIKYMLATQEKIKKFAMLDLGAVSKEVARLDDKLKGLNHLPSNNSLLVKTKKELKKATKNRTKLNKKIAKSNKLINSLSTKLMKLK